MNETMLADIRSQGVALAEGLRSYREQLSAHLAAAERVVLTGSGDSYIAACAVRSLFERDLLVPVVVEPSLDVARFRAFDRGDLVIVISVSGEVARTIEACRRAADSGAMTLAITANAGSTLATDADRALTMPAPLDRSIPHSRDYTVTLLALACVAEAIGGEPLHELDRMPAKVERGVASAFERLGTVARATGRTWFLGAGPDRATAMFGALKFWEAAGLEAWWDDLEEFAHGSQLMARPGDRAVLIADGGGAHRAVEMASGLERMGLEVFVVGRSHLGAGDRLHLVTDDDVSAELHPFVSCVPLQVLTYLEAEARGLDVSVVLDGQEHGAVYDEVHAEWTRRSEIVSERGSG